MRNSVSDVMGIVVVAVVIAYFASSSSGTNFLSVRSLVVFLTTVTVMVGSVLIIRWRRRADPSDQEFATILANISQLPFNEVREMAESLLGRPDKFMCVPAINRDDQRLERLAPEVRGFFKRFERIECKFTPLLLGREFIGSWSQRPELLVIGRGIDEARFLVKANEEQVYELDGSESRNEPLLGFPSVFHLIVVLDRFCGYTK